VTQPVTPRFLRRSAYAALLLGTIAAWLPSATRFILHLEARHINSHCERPAPLPRTAHASSFP
jgi:hypothetical protein